MSSPKRKLDKRLGRVKKKPAERNIGYCTVWAHLAHLIVSVSILVIGQTHPDAFAKSNLANSFVNAMKGIFSAVSNEMSCKGSYYDFNSVMLVAVTCITAHFIILARVLETWDSKESLRGFKSRDWLEVVAAILVGTGLYLFTFQLAGDPTVKGGYAFFCSPPIQFWWFWTTQTLITAWFSMLAVTPILLLIRRRT
jgi:hypothetical protein